MKILVCVKQILDPEMPPKDFKLDYQTNQPVRGMSKLVVDSYAENALEVALQLRDQAPGSTVTAATLADKAGDEVLRRAYAMTADGAVRAWEPAWSDLDGGPVAHVLAQVVRQSGGADLVLVGRQAGDIERGVVGPLMAEELGVPCVTLVTRIEAAGEGRVKLWREVEGGVSVIEAGLPLVVTITNGDSNMPRMPKVKDLMTATRKPITLYSAGDLSVDPAAMAVRTELREIFIPTLSGTCDMVAGDDAPATMRLLTERLRDLKVV